MSQNVTLLSLPSELRLAIYDYLVPTEIHLFRGDRTHDILLLDSFVAKTLHGLLGSCRLMRQETLGVVGNSNIVITGLETFSRPQQACDIVTALTTWASVGGAGNTIWQVARNITVFAGTPLRDGFDSTNNGFSPFVEEPVISFPWTDFSKVLRQSNVATGKLKLRIKTVAANPSLPAFTDIPTGNRAEAMTGCFEWVDATKLRLGKRLEDSSCAGRFGEYDKFLPHSVQGLYFAYKYVVKPEESVAAPVQLEREGKRKGTRRIRQACTSW
ncbi:hypothetical protein KC318_g2805 [Hortaea werneckii]|nr:hypothetical protein KC334_g2995 [Hortaea werneckii]KAI7672538.1 hypothetical protein KC318_g2805 [Hortaea werneckii]